MSVCCAERRALVKDFKFKNRESLSYVQQNKPNGSSRRMRMCAFAPFIILGILESIVLQVRF